jgi:hypothetical protein
MAAQASPPAILAVLLGDTAVSGLVVVALIADIVVAVVALGTVEASMRRLDGDLANVASGCKHDGHK